MPIPISSVYADLLSKLGIESTAGVSTLQQQDCVIAINGALRVLQTAGEVYFTRNKVSLNLTAGVGSYTLGTAIMSVIGPVRLNDVQPLTPLESRGQIDQYDRIFGGGNSFGASSGAPECYYPEYVNNGHSTGNIDQVNLWIVPIPAATGFVTLEVVNQAPSYSASDLTTSVMIPVAQNYTETIFLPIARMLITRSSQFSRPDILKQLTDDYQMAMSRIGYAGGFPMAKQPIAKRETNP